MVAGIVEFLAGALQLSRFISLVPHPVMIGFVNGLALCEARAQVDQFRQHGKGTPFVSHNKIVGMWMTVTVCMISAVLWTRVPRVSKMLPASLAGIIVAMIFAAAIEPWYEAHTLQTIAGHATFPGGMAALPTFNFPPTGVVYNTATLSKVVSNGVRMAIVGLVESLLTLSLVDQITETQGSTTRECYGQSLGNVLCSLFGLQGGCALVGQTLINVGAGGRGRLSGFSMSFGLLISVVIMAPIVGKIPIACMVGLMLLMAINTFAWGCLSLFYRSLIHWTDGFVIVLVTVVTVTQDLATGVIVGLVFSAINYAWTTSKNVHVESVSKAGVCHITICGPLFFGSAMSFQVQIEVGRIAEEKVVLDFTCAQVLDHSALDAIAKVLDRMVEFGKQVEWKGLSYDATRYLEVAISHTSVSRGVKTPRCQDADSGRSISSVFKSDASAGTEESPRSTGPPSSIGQAGSTATGPPSSAGPAGCSNSSASGN
eukprot:gnl/TRDRNA2_/TRDRNA2_86251_c0_seq1.p1 gnl/TRDRNA2_/TRDRNA2_86251_c0~~gnl/TRDRNA2_/TRDRNA2_86251_c0_seq1.p1  ORF type:complete len:516 (+),score=59.60 gnl/TRDRNA2_/TRDRNA2_86251_c0_seq1:96-1550(+)